MPSEMARGVAGRPLAAPPRPKRWGEGIVPGRSDGRGRGRVAVGRFGIVVPWVLRAPGLRAVLVVALLAGAVDGMVLPFLAVTAEARGVSLGAIGAMAAAFLLTQVALQLPLGALSDRAGRVPVLVGGLAVLGVATVGFAAAEGTAGFFGLRVLQGAGVAAILPPLRALVADLSPPHRRGAAYAGFNAAFFGGIFAGPILGGAIVGVAGADALFVVTGALAGLVALGTLRWLRGVGVPRTAPRPGVPGEADPTASTPLNPAPEPVPLRALLAAPLVGAFLLGAAAQVPTGLVNSIWGIYVDDLGATDFQIGLTFSTFAIALLVLAPLGGRIAGRHRRWPILLGTNLALGGIIVAYGLAPSVGAILALGVVEGLFASVALPTLDAYLASEADPRVVGRVQGAFASAGTLGAATIGLLGSPLYGVDPLLPFVLSGGVITVATLVAAPLIRAAERSRDARVALSAAAPPAPRPPGTLDSDGQG